MPILAHLFAPIALLLPAATVDVSPKDDPATSRSTEAQWPAASVPTQTPMALHAMVPGSFIAEGLVDDVWRQVRIEQRIIIRISPRSLGQTVALPSRPKAPPKFVERKTANCLPIVSIAGVQPESSSRLLLVTRNRKFIGASLDKSCHARDFYSGFYVEQNADGQLCAGRDIIHSRAGANCALTKLRELVPDVDDDD